MIDESDIYEKFGYKITERNDLFDEEYGVDEEFKEMYDKLLNRVLSSKKYKAAIPKFEQLALEYPKAPYIKNHLAAFYERSGNKKKALELSEEILEEYPNYIWSKVMKGRNLIADNKYDEVRKLFGNDFDLHKVFPERGVFQLGELCISFELAIYYYMGIEDGKNAAKFAEMLEEISPNPDDNLKQLMSAAKIAENLKKFGEMNAKKIKPNLNIAMPDSENETPPVFNHKEVEVFYNCNFLVPESVQNEILALPRETLIKDLETMLSDAVNRYNYFSEMAYEDNTHSFPIHALYFLRELKATESVPAMLSHFRNNSEFLDYWYGDLLFETLWQCFFAVGVGHIEEMKQFMLLNDVEYEAKTPVARALSQMAIHYPELRDDVSNAFSETLNYYANAKIEDNIIDSDFIASVIGFAIDAKLTELQPVIKTLYEKGYVSLIFQGDYDKVLEHFENDEIEKEDIAGSLTELYGWLEPSSEIDDYKTYDEPKKIETKTGRNDPCPCGSGKKYKKCCLNKG